MKFEVFRSTSEALLHMASGIFRTTLLSAQEQPIFPAKSWGLQYSWHLVSLPCSLLRIWYRMLFAWCVSHWHLPHFSGGISVAIEPEFPMAGSGAYGAVHQQQGRAFLTRREPLCAFYIHRRVKSGMTLVCKVTLNLICTARGGAAGSWSRMRLR